MYGCNFYYELAVVQSYKYHWKEEELIFNWYQGVEIADTEMVHILATYGWSHLWTEDKSVTPEKILWHLVHQ